MVNSGLLTGQKSQFIILGVLLVLSIVFCGDVRGAAKDGDVGTVIAGVIQSQIDVGKTAYARGLYSDAEKAFAQAAAQAEEYHEYLPADVITRAKDLHAKAQRAVAERGQILAHIEAANKLIKMGQLVGARRELEQVKDNVFLTKIEKGQIVTSLSRLDSQLSKSRAEMAEVYNQSVALYRGGKLAQARAGFVKVAESGLLTGASAGKKPEDFIARIDSLAKGPKAIPESGSETRRTVPRLAVVNKPAVDLSAPSSAASNASGESYMERVIRERNVRRNYARTIVTDANDNAQEYMGQGEFENAKYVVDGAMAIVNQYQLDLGELLYNAYVSKLRGLSDEISQRKAIRDADLAEQKKEAAKLAQTEYKEKIEADRSKRISDLLATAKEYGKEQRYKEACGQLKMLLDIDSQHNEALILKQLFEDTMSFRDQIKVVKESRRAQTDLLTKVDESAIPLPGEITYSKDWRDIARKRKPEEAIGEDPRDVAVYKQLEAVVDLSGLSPEMPLSEAIDLLKTSVEPPLTIVVLWRDLADNAEIEQDTPINISPISMAPISTALELILKGVSAGGYSELGYVVQKGVITVATVDSLPSKLVTRVYDVSVLLGQPSQYFEAAGGGGMMGGGMMGGYNQGGYGQGGYGQGGDYNKQYREFSLIQLIQDTIEPDSWWETGTGEGSITSYEGKKMIILQTPEIHKQIAKLLKDLQKSLGEQVSIEARFLVVSENFLQDISLDMDFRYIPGGRWRPMTFMQDTADVVSPSGSKVPGSLGGTVSGLQVSPGYGTGLDDLQVNFLLKAVEAHKDSKSLTAPKVTVLSGESASLSVQTNTVIALPPQMGSNIVGGAVSGLGTSTSMVPQLETIATGTTLSVTPIITSDKKHVLLNIITRLNDFLGMKTYNLETPILSGTNAGALVAYKQELPETEVSEVYTRVSVPDQGTLLLGGQKITWDVESEAGVPVLSHLPIVGRLFRNRGKIRDNKILLILVKPTIILQEERDAEALEDVSGGF